MSRLFESASLGGLRLPNRLVTAPMTRTRAAADGVPQPIMATCYAQRASAGLIIAEAATPNAVGQTYANIPAIYELTHLAGWRHVTDAVRAVEILIARQHLGAGHRSRASAVITGSDEAQPDDADPDQATQPRDQLREAFSGLLVTAKAISNTAGEE